MPVKQFNRQRITDGCLISFDSAIPGNLLFTMNTWIEPHQKARAMSRMQGVEDVNINVMVKERWRKT